MLDQVDYNKNTIGPAISRSMPWRELSNTRLPLFERNTMGRWFSSTHSYNEIWGDCKFWLVSIWVKFDEIKEKVLEYTTHPYE